MAAPQQPVIHLVGRPDALWPSAQELADAVPHVRIVASDTLEQQQQDSVQQQDIVQQQGVVVFILTPEAHLAACRARAPFSFIVLWHQSATEDARLRVRAFAAGANMVTFSREALVTALRTACALSLSGSLSCDWCGLQRLTPADLWHHHPLWHADHEQLEGACQICGQANVNIGWHVHTVHRPPGHPALPPRTGVYALAVIRRPTDGRFLLVQESGKEGYWLAGGGVDPGESLRQGALREALEEAGVRIKLTGVLGVDVHRKGTWRRVTFLAELDPPDQTPKTLPDAESAGACWVSADELQALPLRGGGVDLHWLPFLAGGGKAGPLEVPHEHRAAFADWPF